MSKLLLVLTFVSIVNGVLLGTVQADPTPQIMRLKFKLDSDTHNEWIRMELSGDTLKVFHTTYTDSDFSRKTGWLPMPIPIPKTHTWHDHHTTHVAFQPSNCSDHKVSASKKESDFPSCSIAGDNSLTFPKEMDIHNGRFKIEYIEDKLLRSIIFKVPSKTQFALDQPNTKSEPKQ